MGYLVLWDTIDPGNSGGSVPTPDSPWTGHVIVPEKFACLHCQAQFATKDELFEHRFNEHPYRRPVLFYQGRELNNPREDIYHVIAADDFDFKQADWLELEGERVSEAVLRHFLTQQRQKIVKIRLVNEGLSSEYELKIHVADLAELAQVDELFFTLLDQVNLSVLAVDQFVKACRKFNTVLAYVDGLSHYIYAILAKDQTGGTQLRRDQAKGRMSRALEVLKRFDTPLARAICGVINFNLNCFSAGSTLEHAPKLQQAMQWFHHLQTQVPNLAKPTGIGVIDQGLKLPLDRFTDSILNWVLMPLERQAEQLDLIVQSKRDSAHFDEDKLKLSMLLSQIYLFMHDYAPAKHQARGSMNDPAFGAWAQAVLDQCETMNEKQT
ncbi:MULTISPECIES: hypothetical protein [Deefgea]|uniref:C2H2-type domain-containing protein n=1 Tax=Deefgea chitinilytica TaxID=570276 RepID=A0ABS2C8S7_9NEIS|nr:MULTISPECIES: hypothetical protein [Deefgea]MBM5570543.1 hypothetical protein [Deefgea chitinilytica]MBM9887772.1 hypothetical protein [Deefgea sp. CFH1-16]